MDKLEAIFKMQAALNDRVFAKQNIKSLSGEDLTSEQLYLQGLATSPKGPNTDTNRWLRKFLEALQDESRELGDELLMKWWSKDYLDMQNIRVEIIDQLHFWISLALTAGLDADKVYDIYEQKNLVNIQRQEKGYNMGSKTEEDNQNIK
jgi:dimeric dUTPase (all-alpha-NTP-PPase superfamily)